MASDNQDLQMQYREKSKTYYILMVYEDADATLLRLFECFMESAPQLVLQVIDICCGTVSVSPFSCIACRVSCRYTS